MRNLLWIVLAIIAAALYLRFAASPPTVPAPGPVPNRVPASAESEKEPRSAPTRESVVATVGPLKIELGELLDLTREMEDGLKQRNPGEFEESLRGLREDTLQGMVERRLLVLGSAKHPEWVSDATWEAEVQKQLAELGPEGIQRRREILGQSAEEFQQAFRKYVRENLMKEAILRQEVESRSVPSEEEMKARYEKDLEAVYHRPDSWRAIQIILPVTGEAGLEGLERLRAEMARAVEDASGIGQAAGVASELAQSWEKSEGILFKQVVYYDTPKAMFDAAFLDRLKRSKVGDLSEVFALEGTLGERGHSFFLTLQNLPGEYAPYERVRGNLRQAMIEENRLRLRSELIDRLKKQFPVTIEEDLLAVQSVEEPKEEASL